MTRKDEKDRAPVVIGSGRFANAQLNENMSYTVILVARSVSGAKDEFSQTFTLDQKIPEPERPVPCFKEFRNGAVLAREERQCVYTAEDCTKLGGTPSASGLETTDACLDRCDTYEAIEFSSSTNDGSSAECHEKVCVSSFTSGPYNTLKGDDCTPIEPDEPDETGTGGTGGTEPGTGPTDGDCSSRLTSTLWGRADPPKYWDLSFEPDGSCKFFSRWYIPSDPIPITDDLIESGEWTMDDTTCQGHAVVRALYTSQYDFTLSGDELTIGAAVYRPIGAVQTPLGTYSQDFP
jgi:hypothetical protein